MLKILQYRLQQYVNLKLSDVQDGFRKSRGTRNQIVPASVGSLKKQENSRNNNNNNKNLLLLHSLHQSLRLCGSQKNWKIPQEMGVPDHLICLLRNLYASQQATIRTGHGTTDCFQIGKGVHQCCILSSRLFNLYAMYIMQNTRLNEAQAEIYWEKYQ